MAKIKRSIFNGNEFFPLISNGRRMIVDKIVYLTKHDTLTAGSPNDARAGSVSVYGIPGHDESKDDKILIESKKFNLPSVAGEWCETIIKSDVLSEHYSAIIVEVDYEGNAPGDLYLNTDPYEMIILKSPMDVKVNNENTE